MTWLRTAGAEILGLFVDDVRFAVAVFAWLLLTGLGLPRLGLAGGWAGLILASGLAIILVDSVIRQSRS